MNPWFGVSFVAWLLATLAPGLAAAQSSTLSAIAGLDGVGRPGRWAPIRVTVDAGSQDILGVLAAEWGDARVERPVSLTAPARRTFELYLRTGNPRDVVHVSLATPDTTWTADAPLRLAPFDARLRLCLSGAREDGPCDLHLPSNDLPLSWRGYDAADAITVTAPPFDASEQQRDALLLAGRLRQAGDAGTLNVATAGLLAPSPPATLVRVPLLAYFAALASVALVSTILQARVAWLGAAGLVIVAASVAASRTGVEEPLTLQHASVAHQFQDVPRTFVTGSALVVPRSPGRLRLTAPDGDGVIESTAQETAYEDGDGRSVLARTLGMGEAQRIVYEMTEADLWLEITRSNEGIRLTNVSPHALRDCEVSGSGTTVSAVAPGASFEMSGTEGENPVVTCHADATLTRFESNGRAVQHTGVTTVVAHLLPRVADVAR